MSKLTGLRSATLLALLAAAPGFAQTITSVASGTVSDSTVPAAVGTGASGGFVFPSVLPATDSVIVEAMGSIAPCGKTCRSPRRSA